MIVKSKNKKFFSLNNKLDFQEAINDYDSYSPTNVINRINESKWREIPYKKQNWGNWLHRMGPYIGKIKPAMAYQLIISSTKKNSLILDPFCGVGTVLLESSFNERFSIGNDLNPYAFTISMAKSERIDIDDHISYLKKIKINYNKKDKNFSDFLVQFYDKKTLKEIIFLIDNFKKNKKYFLLGCLLGIIHGHRPGHLSASTSLVIPYTPREKPEYREVIPRLIEKVKRMYRDGFYNSHIPEVLNEDSKKMSIKSNSVDAVISSPPYYNTLDYTSDNRLRNEFLGVNEDKKKSLKSKLSIHNKSYLKDMEIIGLELKRVLKKGAYCIFVLGDHHTNSKIINTAEEVAKIYEKIGFITCGMVNDKMPTNKAIPDSRKRNKLDRILVMTNGQFKEI